MNAPHFDQQPVLPPTIESVVLRYCFTCKKVKPKDGPRASEAKFVCAECCADPQGRVGE